MKTVEKEKTTCVSVELGLVVPDKDSVLLDQTLQAFNAAATYVSSRAFTAGATNAMAIQRLFYSDLRERFGLSAQHACLCCKEVAAKFAAKTGKPTVFRPLSSIPFDVRTFTLSKDLDSVTLTTLKGREAYPSCRSAAAGADGVRRQNRRSPSGPKWCWVFCPKTLMLHAGPTGNQPNRLAWGRHRDCQPGRRLGRAPVLRGQGRVRSNGACQDQEQTSESRVRKGKERAETQEH